MTTIKEKDIIALFRPYRHRKQPMYGVLTAIFTANQVPNKSTSIDSRANDSFNHLHRSLAFLTGFLTLLPHLGLKRSVQLQADGLKLAHDAYTFLRTFGNASVSKVRRLRVFNERIVGFIEKVEKDCARAERAEEEQAFARAFDKD